MCFPFRRRQHAVSAPLLGRQILKGRFSMSQPAVVRLGTAAALLLLAAAISPRATAQFPPRQPTPNDTLRSPEVLPDHRVTFRIYAPKASEVTIGGDWITQGLGTGGKLEKDDQG